MAVKNLVVGIIFITVGLVVMFRHKFYKHDSNDMRFLTKFDVFLSGFFLAACGVLIIISEAFNFFR